MRFAAIALLFGFTSAYVVTNDNAMSESAVAARNVVSGSVSNMVIDARDPHHKGRGGRGKKREAGAEIEIEAREPHHKGRDGRRQREAEIDAREPHHKGRGGRRRREAEGEADIEAREPHHKGRGGRGGRGN